MDYCVILQGLGQGLLPFLLCSSAMCVRRSLLCAIYTIWSQKAHLGKPKSLQPHDLITITSFINVSRWLFPYRKHVTQFSVFFFGYAHQLPFTHAPFVLKKLPYFCNFFSCLFFFKFFLLVAPASLPNSLFSHSPYL